MTSTPCPTCGRHDFADDSYMKRHHAQVHGESIAGFPTTCTECGDTVIKVQESHTKGLSFCNKECESEWRTKQTGEDSFRWEGGVPERECPICEETHKNGGRYRKTCSDECLERYHKSRIGYGENNPNWKGGYGEYYGSEWEEAREVIRERDENICQVCEETSENWMPVHHIIPVREFDDPNEAHFEENMVQVCRSCHMTVESMSTEKQKRLFGL